MPAGSDSGPAKGGAPALPRTWRPLGVRLAGWVFGMSLLIVTAVAWFAVPAGVRDGTTLFQRVTLLGFAVLALVIMYALMRSKVVATTDGLLVVNGYRQHELAWPQVIAVSMAAGAPWATLDLADGTNLSVMGIQGSDGQRARTAVRELRALLND